MYAQKRAIFLEFSNFSRTQSNSLGFVVAKNVKIWQPSLKLNFKLRRAFCTAACTGRLGKEFSWLPGAYNSFCHKNRRFHTCNVTSKATWTRHVNDILAGVKACDFVALDVEYTGLHFKDDRYIGVDKCYEAHASGAKQFIPCQLGLTLAKHLDRGVWKITPTSLYILPSENRTFSLSTNTLSFLKDNNFDFNDWIRNGIGFLRPQEEKQRKSNIEAQISEIQTTANQAQNENPPDKPCEFDLSTIPDEEDRILARGIIQQINEWIASDSKEPLEIAMDSPFHRLLMHTIIGQQFPSVYSHSTTREDNVKYLSIYKSHEELLQERQRQLEQELAKIDAQVGIRLILDAIIERKKVLIGHNCFYDILHIYQTFYDELPEKVEDFKTKWIEKFPCMFDTKYLAECQETPAFSNCNGTLKSLFDYLCSQEVANGNNRVAFEFTPLTGTFWHVPKAMSRLLKSENSSGTIAGASSVASHAQHYSVVSNDGFQGEQTHDAGYDSLMTMIIFILQANRILKAKEISWSTAMQYRSAEHSSMRLLHIMDKVKNSIRLVKSQPSFINLGASKDLEMDRYFYMSGFPNSWKKWDITKIWSPLWVSVSWIDETSCWVIVKNDEDVRNINLIYRMMKNPQFTLMTYERYKQSAHATPAAAA